MYAATAGLTGTASGQGKKFAETASAFKTPHSLRCEPIQKSALKCVRKKGLKLELYLTISTLTITIGCVVLPSHEVKTKYKI